MTEGAGANVDWDEEGTLRQEAGGYNVRTDALWILVTAAMQGHEGSVEDFTIRMPEGVVYGPEQIQALALLPGRKRMGP